MRQYTETSIRLTRRHWPNSTVRLGLVVIAAVVVAAGCSSGTAITKQTERQRANVNVDRNIDQEFQKSVAYMQAGHDSEAENVLVNLTRQQPSLAGPHINLGLVYLRTNRLEEAKSEFDRVVELQPKSPEAYNYLGVTYRNMGEFSKAEESYQQALKIDPNYADAHLNLGILYDLYMVQLDKALTHYQKYQQLNGPSDKQVELWIADVESRVASNTSPGKEDTQ